MRRACSTHGKGKKYIKCLLEKLKGRYHSEDLGIGENIILEEILGKWGGKLLTGFFRIGTSGVVL
jgi:hypothetical protein